MANYVYKVKHKYLKPREDNSREIEDYFHKAEGHDDEGYEETLYYINYRLRPESDLVRRWVKMCNDPEWQKISLEKEGQLQKLEEEGLFFDYDPETKHYLLNEEKTDMTDFEMVKIGFTLNEPITKNIIFITTSGNTDYFYNTKILDENCGDIVAKLLEDGIIYKALSPRDAYKRKHKEDNPQA